MKINGVTISGPTPEVIVIPKNGKELVIKAMPILDYEEFNGICPVPKPPEVIKKGGEKFKDYDDKKYNEALTDWAERKNAWMIIKSLAVTDGIEWDTVDISKPETWKNYLDDLKSVFTEIEISLIIDLVHIACGLNQTKIDEATKRFLAGQGQE